MNEQWIERCSSRNPDLEITNLEECNELPETSGLVLLNRRKFLNFPG